MLCTHHSALTTLHSLVCTHKSVLTNLHSLVCTHQFAFTNLHSQICIHQSALSKQHSVLMLHLLCFIQPKGQPVISRVGQQAILLSMNVICISVKAQHGGD